MTTPTDELIAGFGLAEFRASAPWTAPEARDGYATTGSGRPSPDAFAAGEKRKRDAHNHLLACPTSRISEQDLADREWCGNDTCSTDPCIRVRVICDHEDSFGVWTIEADTMAELLNRIAAFADAQ